MSDWLFKAHFEYPPKWWTCSAVTWLVPRETAAVSARSVYTIQPCTISRHFIAWVRACLALTCHLHFWQNDWVLVHAIAVTQGWNGYWNKSQHRKLTIKKIFKECESLSLKSPDVNQFIFSFVIFMVFVYNAVPILLNKRFRTQQRCTNEMIKWKTLIIGIRRRVIIAEEEH